MELAERIEAVERDFEQVRLDWLDTLGKLTKIGAKMAAQQRRDLAKAAGGEDQLAAFDTPAPPPVALDRASRKAQLRRSLNHQRGA